MLGRLGIVYLHVCLLQFYEQQFTLDHANAIYMYMYLKEVYVKVFVSWTIN